MKSLALMSLQSQLEKDQTERNRLQEEVKKQEKKSEALAKELEQLKEEVESRKEEIESLEDTVCTLEKYRDLKSNMEIYRNLSVVSPATLSRYVDPKDPSTERKNVLSIGLDVSPYCVKWTVTIDPRWGKECLGFGGNDFEGFYSKLTSMREHKKKIEEILPKIRSIAEIISLRKER